MVWQKYTQIVYISAKPKSDSLIRYSYWLVVVGEEDFSIIVATNVMTILVNVKH